MPGHKRKATDQQTRASTAVLFQEPIPRSRSITATARPPQRDVMSRLLQLWNRSLSWILPTTHMEMVAGSDEGEEFSFEGERVADGCEDVPTDHIESSTRRSDGEIASKRRRTQNRDGMARPKSANDAGHVPQKIINRKIDFGDAQDDGQRVKILDEYWEPPQFGFLQGKKLQKKVLMEALDESLGGLQLGSKATLITPSSSPGDSAQQHNTSTPRRSIHQLLQTPESLPRTTIRPSKSLGNLKRQDCVKIFFDDEGDYEELPIATRKKIELEVLKRDKERRELEEKRKAAKQRRLARQAPLKPLIEALNTRWNSRVTDVQHSRDPGRILTKSFEGTELRVKDFGTLLGNNAWLNDEIINTYIEWIVIAANKASAAESEAAGEPISTVPKFLAHNSFFWNNLRDKGPKSTERLMKRKKVPGTSLLEVDTVFIPINKGAHWTIGLVRPVARTIEYLDSMGGRGADVIPVLTGWVKHQLGSQYDEKEWTVPRTACAHQSNGYDCGVFLCTNALCVALGINPDCYHQRDLIQQRKNIAAVLLNRGFEGDFRWDAQGFLG